MPITAILFDLGNVVAPYRPVGAARLADCLGIRVEVLDGCVASGMIARLAVGRETPEAFAAALSEGRGQPLTRADLVACFGPELGPAYPEIAAALPALSEHYRLGILSNTFFGHWDAFIQRPEAGLFHMLAASHEIGVEKPGPAAYEQALSRLGTPAQHTLFIDDLSENVAAAHTLGIHAFTTDSPATTLAGLRRLGIRTSQTPRR
jgi:putative hydrolase of the HAD superfamily